MIHKHDILALGNDRLRRLATASSVSVAVALVIIKLAAWLMTDSVAMLSSLLDSAIDFLASLVTAYGVAKALRPPDREHRYGHGKAEPLAALAQSAFIIGSAILLGVEVAQRLTHPRPIEKQWIGYIVMAMSIVLTIILVMLQNHVVRATGSVAIRADRLHYAGDLAINLAVVAAFALHGLTGLNWFDPVFAIAIASGLLISAFHILKQALHALMDSELPPARRAEILAIVERQPGVIGAHDMRTRSDGDRIFIDLHVEMDGDMTLRAAHDLSERITAALRLSLPNADVMIHQDPAGLDEERRDARIERQAAKLH